MKTMHSLRLVALALAGSASAAHAIDIYGLTSANELIRFDSTNPSVVFNIGVISQPGIVDLDFYPTNGLLYAITSTGSTFSLNLSNASATLLFSPLTSLSNLTDFDFNPAVDRMRIFGDTDQNYRMVPDFITAPSAPGTAGTVISDGTFSNAAFQLVGSAYTNNFDGTASTTLYSIDTATDSLVIHSGAPQFNTVTAVGSGLTQPMSANVGFDIGQDGVAYLSSDNSFFTVNLASGVATPAGTVGGSGLISIAAVAVPEPSAALLGLLGLSMLTGRRTRQA